MTRTDAARHRWEDRTKWWLLLASALFLFCYSWVSLDQSVSHAWFVVLVTILGLVWVAFFVDYLVRLLLSSDRADFVRHNLIDLASVFIPIARPFRMLILLRKVPLLRGNRGNVLRARVIINASAFVVMFIYVISLAELNAERGAPDANIVTFGDSVWWACVTMATVGYGDYFPVTTLGRILAVLLMAGGVVIVGAASATIVSYLAEHVTHTPPRNPVRHDHPSPEPVADAESTNTDAGDSHPDASDSGSRI
jgi:voltage-gated potassium channel